MNTMMILRARNSKSIIFPSGGSGNTNRCKLKKKHSGGKSQEDDEDCFPDQEPKGSFAWKCLSLQQMKNLHKCENEKELEKWVREMQVEDFEYDLRAASLLDYYLSNFHWAKEQQQFDKRQISAYMTMVVTQINNIREHNFSKLESFVYMKQCLNGVGVEPSDNCAYPLYMINNDQAKLIVEFNTSTFLLNYSLYEHVFRCEQDEIIIGKEVVVEYCSKSVQFPTPLEESVHMESYTLNKTIAEHSGGDEEICVEDEISEEEKFVEAVVAQVKQLQHPQTIDVDQLRSMVDKFTKGVLLPNKRSLEEKIKQRQVVLMEKIDRENQATQECP